MAQLKADFLAGIVLLTAFILQPRQQQKTSCNIYEGHMKNANAVSNTSGKLHQRVQHH